MGAGQEDIHTGVRDLERGPLSGHYAAVTVVSAQNHSFGSYVL